MRCSLHSHQYQYGPSRKEEREQLSKSWITGKNEKNLTNSEIQQEQQDLATHTDDALLRGGVRGQPLSSEHGRGRGPCAHRGRAAQRDPLGLSATSPEASSLKGRRAQRIYYPQRALEGSRRAVSFLPNG